MLSIFFGPPDNYPDKNTQLINNQINNSQQIQNLGVSQVKKPQYLREKTKCTYCMKYPVEPLKLNCGHIICIDCGVEVKSLAEFLIGKRNNYIECPECNLKTFYTIDTSITKVSDLELIKKVGCVSREKDICLPLSRQKRLKY